MKKIQINSKGAILKYLLLPVMVCMSAGYLTAAPLEGRWDITITMAGKKLPSWLEVSHSGTRTLVGRFVYAFGSARPVAKINFASGKFSFSIPPQWEPGTRDMKFEGKLTGDSLTGTMLYTDGKKYNWTAVRAPNLRRQTEPVWGEPISLFNGANLDGWHALGNNQWKAVSGILESLKSGSNLVTDKNFKWKVFFVVALTAIAVWQAYPLDQKIRLGLDLKGGMQLVLQVDMSKVPENQRRHLSVFHR